MRDTNISRNILLNNGSFLLSRNEKKIENHRVEKAKKL